MYFSRIRRTGLFTGLSLFMFLLYGIMLLAQMPCIILYVFRIPCPGCGMRDALRALLRFDFIAAFRSHPMVWSLPLLPVLILSNGKPTRFYWVNIFTLGIVLGGFLMAYFYRLTVYLGL